MSGKMVPKLRIVRCPKCRQLLQEPTGYDVYKCGGCGTDLQGNTSNFWHVNFQECPCFTNKDTDIYLL